MRRWKLQCFFLFVAGLLRAHAAEPDLAITFTDVDGNKISTNDGRINTIVIARSDDVDKSRLVGDRSPEHCVGNQAYRFITVLTFAKQHGPTARKFFNAVARHRLDGEAKRLQPRYTALRRAQDPRTDMCLVLDFDGTVATELGAASSPFEVIVLGRRGQLIKRWKGVPSADEFAAALKAE